MQDLCDQLGIAPEYTENQEQLKKLEHWCKTQLSSDLSCHGTAAAQYDFYFNKAKEFIELFIKNLPDDLNTSVAAYNFLTPIQYAAYQGYNFFIDSLSVPHVALFNDLKPSGMSPLHFAATCGHRATCVSLLKRKAKATVLNINAQPPLFSALMLPIAHPQQLTQAKERIFRLLEESAPEMMKHQDSDGNTVFHLMAAQGFVSLLKEYIEKYPSVTLISNNQGQFPIHSSILNNQLLATQLLSTVDAAYRLKDPFGQTPLHYAARYGDKEMLSLLCHPDSLNAQDTEGKTPLIWAVETNNLAAAKVLIEQGADPSITDYLGYSMQHYVRLSKNTELLNWGLEQAPK